MPTSTLSGGIVINSYPAPPASFDLGKATHAERALYGIPGFPAGTDLEKRFAEMARRLRFVEPVFKQRERRRRYLPDLKAGHGTQTTAIWSGGITFPSLGDRISFVMGSWYVPEVWTPTDAQKEIWYSASTWLGIDGDYGSGDVLQAGCDAEGIILESGVTQYEFNPWFEWYPAGSHWIKSLPPTSPGDEFSCWMQSVPSLAGSANANSAFIFLANLTAGFGSLFVATAPPGVLLMGNCAEWIVEALESGPDNLPQLANYSTVTFSSCKCLTAGGTVIDVGTGNTIDMVDSGNKVISKGKIVGSNEVQVLWASGCV
jgi:hypothetical protein